MTKRFAILEDDPGRTRAMKDILGRRLLECEALFFDSAPDMLVWLPEGLPDVSLLSLDHDLGPTRNRDGERYDPGIGRDVVDYLEQQDPVCPVIIHSSNGPAADGMLYALRFADWVVERVLPHDDLAWVEASWIQRVEAHLTEG